MTPRLILGVALLLAACSGAAGEGIAGDTGSAACGTCHATQFAAWSSSRLASSGTSPVFLALKNRMSTAWGAEAASECVGCHQPSFATDHAIGCVACHSATGNLATRDGLLVVDTTQPVSGPFSDPAPTPAHGSRTYDFLESSDLCGTCHELTGPKLFHETTLTEFETSSQAASGATCRECHLPPVASGPIATGASSARSKVDHSFAGIDPAWGASASAAATSQARTLALLQSALSLTAVARRGGYDVTLTNHAAHAVPTGIAFLRGVWVDATLTGADGTQTTLSSLIELGAQPTASGAPVPLVTMADSVVDQALPSGSSKTFHVDAPSTLTLPVRAVFTLRARAIRADVLDALGLDAMESEVPTHDVATATVP
jgi:hypothetical protein